MSCRVPDLRAQVIMNCIEAFEEVDAPGILRIGAGTALLDAAVSPSSARKHDGSSCARTALCLVIRTPRGMNEYSEV